jgi:hypothetical protein
MNRRALGQAPWRGPPRMRGQSLAGRATQGGSGDARTLAPVARAGSRERRPAPGSDAWGAAASAELCPTIGRGRRRGSGFSGASRSPFQNPRPPRARLRPPKPRTAIPMGRFRCIPSQRAWGGIGRRCISRRRVLPPPRWAMRQCRLPHREPARLTVGSSTHRHQARSRQPGGLLQRCAKQHTPDLQRLHPGPGHVSTQPVAGSRPEIVASMRVS